jgi:AraC-like DNA-binding protein
MEPHGHRFFEIIYSERGGGWHQLAGHTVEIRPGDLFLIAPGEVHDSGGINEDSGRVVLFTTDAVKTPIDTLSYLWWLGNPLLLGFLRPTGISSGYFNIPKQERSLWTEHLMALETELQTRRPGYDAALRARLTLILVEATRLASETLSGFPLHEQPILAEVFSFIEAQYAEPISLNDVAKAVGLSGSHLTTIVRRLTGWTVGEWIMERRLVEARRLLLETDETIADIGERVGYPDSTYFIRRFRRQSGMTPVAWRRANR